LAAVLAGQGALAATLSLSAESEAIHTNMPFTLALSAKGFEEEPTPAPPDLVIEGCEVTYLGVGPSVSTRVEIINGRRSDWREVTFVYRWRVVAPTAGRYTVPPLRVEQGNVQARLAAVTFEAADVPSSQDMIVRLRLPERAVWVGETFDVAVEWLLARDVRDHRFAVPLFNLDGAEVNVPPGSAGGRSLAFQAGARQVELPLVRTEVEENGKRYTRFAFAAQVTMNRPGTVDLDPVRVVAQLATGTSRDSWGFSRPRYELFGAEGDGDRLTVRPLPNASRPSTFVNAIGRGFSIDVQASRTVVSVGEPVELTVRLRGDGSLTGLSLPPLGGPDALPPAHFSVPEGSVPGEIDEESGSKAFDVTVRVRSRDVREIPPIAFSYFDPQVGEYRTVRSRPIALSVDVGQVVGVDDVVAAPSVVAQSAEASRPDAGGTNANIATLVGADMSLSDPARALSAPWGSGDLGPALGALYGIPLVVVLVLVWLARSDDRRAQGRSVRGALRNVEQALAGDRPARQAAPLIVTAMHRLADVSGNDAGEAAGLLERLETRAFDPAAADETVSDEVAGELRRIARRWATKPAGAAPVAVSAVVAVALLIGAPALASTPDDSHGDHTKLQQLRDTYRSALEEPDRLRRVRLFAEAESALRSLAAANVDAPELQVDWGNAALGAQDPGRAVLAYRRALETAPANERARANLAWLRGRLPVWLPRPATTGALDSLMFWRERLTAAQLHLVGGAAFAIGVLLFAPWPRRPRAFRVAAVPALVLWAVATGSAVLAGGGADQAVVVQDGATLRSADSAGASPSFANPLPAGTEVTLVESRDAWVRVALADGTRGWVSGSAVERVHATP